MSDDHLQLHTIFKGEVVSVQEYGVFVKIPNMGRKNGLVHKSQMSQTKIEHPDDMVEKGERVWCKVISMEEGGEKIGLSMKVVNQTTGTDLDKNNVQSSRDEQNRKKGGRRERPKIELGAVLSTTCRKCGGKGHFAQDCFHRPGGSSYALLDDDDVSLETKDKPSRDSERKKKKEKHKKKKKRKHSYDSENDEPKRKTEKKSKKSKHKRKYDSSSDSSSDSEVERSRTKHRHKKRRHTSSDSDMESHNRHNKSHSKSRRN